MKKIVLLALLIALPAQAQTKTAAESPERVLVTLTDAQIAMVKAAVADQLKDPEASRFSRIKASGFLSESKMCPLWATRPTYTGLRNSQYSAPRLNLRPPQVRPDDDVHRLLSTPRR
jgi:hypothetical protein